MFSAKNKSRLMSVLVILAFVFGAANVGPALATYTLKNDPQGSTPDVKAAQSSNQCLGARAETVRHKLTGQVRFVGTKPGKPIPQPVESLRFASPETAARGYLSRCGSLFGLDDQAAELVVKRQEKTEDGRSVIRFRQIYQGIPIFGGELVV